MTNEQVRADFEICFNGAHHGGNDDLLTPLADRAPGPAHGEDHPASYQRVDLSEARQLLLSLLSERSIWSLKGLRAKSELAPRAFWDSIQNLRRQARISSPTRGWVGLVR